MRGRGGQELQKDGSSLLPEKRCQPAVKKTRCRSYRLGNYTICGTWQVTDLVTHGLVVAVGLPPAHDGRRMRELPSDTFIVTDYKVFLCLAVQLFLHRALIHGIDNTMQ
ncbi:hypothetical protein STEG23_031859 [Scotinomys teguina]